MYNVIDATLTPLCLVAAGQLDRCEGIRGLLVLVNSEWYLGNTPTDRTGRSPRRHLRSFFGREKAQISTPVSRNLCAV